MNAIRHERSKPAPVKWMSSLVLSTRKPAKRLRVESEKIPARVQFSAKPETERWREFLSWWT